MERSIERVLDNASRMVTPTVREDEKLRRVADKVSNLLYSAIGDSSFPQVVLGGSYSKGTWLKKEADIDYFLRYQPEFPREKLEKEAIQLAIGAVKGYVVNMRYAEHPYVETFVEDVRVNLVPCYNVEKGKWQSAVDRSPFHSEYIKSRFDQRLRLETRLLKKFVKSANAYGAEIKVRGLSGYVCEVLVLKYGSFVAALTAISNFRKGETISIEPFKSAHSFESAVVILDPIDTTRNLGTAISTEKLGGLLLKSRAFLAKPSISYFTTYSFTRKTVNTELLKRILVIRIKNKERSADILWGELRKSASSIDRKLETLGFKVLRYEVGSDEKSESAFAFLLLDRYLGSYSPRFGPDIFRKEDLERYLSKNRKKYIISWIDSEGRVVSLFRRDPGSQDAFSTMRKILSSPKEVEKLGLSKSIRNEIKHGFSLTDGVSTKSEVWLRRCIDSLVSEEREFD
ncbi:MAG TPA: CCA tRNA nucleotidyltransferase [Nitrososphaerales archaeon]|nr:CCA tRNA nucleotidyltransferase [Nitrososphaerales archaeon]